MCAPWIIGRRSQCDTAVKHAIRQLAEVPRPARARRRSFESRVILSARGGQAWDYTNFVRESASEYEIQCSAEKAELSAKQCIRNIDRTIR